jgi:hypothetical protein
MSSPAGYSGTPLWKKLGLKPALRILVLNPPQGFEALLSGAPSDLDRLSRLAPFDLALSFVGSVQALTATLAKLEPILSPDGMIWIAWPKRTSGVATDLSENAVRDKALALGLADVKVCAIDRTWSGLKLVRRLRDRAKQTPRNADASKRAALKARSRSQ